MIQRLQDTDADAARDEGRPYRGRRRRRRRTLKLSMLPTMLTLGNLVCGVLALAYAADAWAFYATGQAGLGLGRLRLAGWMILLGMVFDSLDGSVARLTRTTTEFGGALDSLADVVTFGVAPALVTKVIIQGTLDWTHPRLVFLTAGFFAICATLRLARYNVEQEDGKQPVRFFVGLPTPGAAGVLAALAVSLEMLLEFFAPGPDAIALAALVLVLGGLVGLGLLMVSRVPYVHVANRLLRGRARIGRVALLLLVVMLGASGREEIALLAIFWGYALAGPAVLAFSKLRSRHPEGAPEAVD